MAAHRQAATRLDKENTDVGVRARRWIQETAAHHIVAARLENEAGAYPIEARNEVAALLAHRDTFNNPRAAGNEANGIPRSVSVNAEERVTHQPTSVSRYAPSRCLHPRGIVEPMRPDGA